MGHFRLGKTSADFIRLNPAFSARPKIEAENSPKTARNGNQRVKSLNKTETLFLNVLKRDFEAWRIFSQPTRFFPLTGGGTYTPDFLVFKNDGVMVYEVKGGYRGPGWEQGYERYRRAALEWSRGPFRFAMATFDRKTGRWRIEGWEGDR